MKEMPLILDALPRRRGTDDPNDSAGRATGPAVAQRQGERDRQSRGISGNPHGTTTWPRLYIILEKLTSFALHFLFFFFFFFFFSCVAQIT